MTRWGLAVLVAALLIGGAAIVVARVLGRSGSRASLLVSVVAQWLGAYVVWSFLGGLALHYGLLTTYDGAPFALLALAGGYWQFVTAVTRGQDRARLVYVGVQLAWLVVVLYRNGRLWN